LSYDLRYIALGAGVQSTVMLLMAARGELGDPPDAAIFADTGWEPPSVYRHLEWLERQVAIPVYRVSAGNLRDDVLAGLEGKRFSNIPAFVDLGDGTEGRLRRNCTRDYKVYPIESKVRELLGVSRVSKQRAQGWQGISLDEVQRMRVNRTPWIDNLYPLVDRGMTRHDCLRWMAAQGYHEPPKSACIGCPYHNNAMWRDMKESRIDDWHDAVAFDHQIRSGLRGVKRTVYLHRSLVPLDEVDLRSAEDMGQLNMFIEECEGLCGV
jgi:hypothetical protein